MKLIVLGVFATCVACLAAGCSDGVATIEATSPPSGEYLADGGADGADGEVIGDGGPICVPTDQAAFFKYGLPCNKDSECLTDVPAPCSYIWCHLHKCTFGNWELHHICGPHAFCNEQVECCTEQ